MVESNRGRARTIALLTLLRLGERLVGVVPAPVALPLCRAASLAWWRGASEARSAARANLRIVLGREPRAAEVAEVFYHGVLNYWDTFRMARLTSAAVERYVSVQGWSYLDDALALGRGVIVAGPHLSSAGLAGHAIVARGYRVVVVVEPVRPPEVLEFFRVLRGRHGADLVVAGREAIRPLLAALRRGEVVGIVADRDVLGTGRPITFLGHTTTFPEGPAALAVRTGATIVPAFAYRDTRGGLHAVLDRPIDFAPSGTSSQDVHTLSQALADRLGGYIRAFPLQWTVFQPRWPTLHKDSW